MKRVRLIPFCLIASVFLTAFQSRPVAAQAVADAAASVIEAIKGRESAVTTLKFVAVRKYGPGSDWKQYRAASQQSRNALLRFLGNSAEEPRSSDLPPIIAQKTISQCESIVGRRRFDVFGANDVPIRSAFFDKSVWQIVNGGLENLSKASRIDIASQIPWPDSLQALGLCAPISKLNTSGAVQQDQNPVLLSTHLRKSMDTGLLSNVKEWGDEGIQVTFVEPTSARLKDIRTGEALSSTASGLEHYLGFEIHLFLDSDKGFAPIRASGRLVGAGPNGWTETIPQQQWTVDWSEFKEDGPGTWFPRRAIVDCRMGVVNPNGGEFKPMLGEHGRPLVATGSSQFPDFGDAKSTLYSIAKVAYEFSDFALNKPLDEPLFPQEFVAGTVVQDRRTNEVFQLTGLSPAVDAKMKRLIRYHLAQTMVPIPVSHRWWLIAVNVVAVALCAVWMIVRYRRGRKESAG